MYYYSVRFPIGKALFMMIHSKLCSTCGNMFQSQWLRCKHCGAKKSINVQAVTIGIMITIIIIFCYLIFMPS